MNATVRKAGKIVDATSLTWLGGHLHGQHHTWQSIGSMTQIIKVAENVAERCG